MARVYQSLCNEADVLLQKITNLVEKQINYKLEMERLMNSGFVKIAKARYIMGSTCVTKMQLPSENSNPIQPIATVYRKKKKNSWIFHIHRKDVTKQCFKKNNDAENPNESHNKNDFISVRGTESILSDQASHHSEEDFKNMLQNNPKALKKAKKAFHVDDCNYEECKEELLDEFSNQGSNESFYSLTDPVRLFGILVPNTLKEAQEKFIRVVNLLGKSATIQLLLRENLFRYNHLNKVKMLMEMAASEMKINLLETKIYWTLVNAIDTSDNKIRENSESASMKVTKSIISVFHDDFSN